MTVTTAVPDRTGVPDPGTIPAHALRRVIDTALEEDAPWGDVTSEAFIPLAATATATLAAREPGVLSGGGVFVAVMHAVDPTIGPRCTWPTAPGSSPGTPS